MIDAAKRRLVRERAGHRCETAYGAISDLGNDVWLSVVNGWEIQIKVQLGKLILPKPLRVLLQEEQAMIGAFLFFDHTGIEPYGDRDRDLGERPKTYHSTPHGALPVDSVPHLSHDLREDPELLCLHSVLRDTLQSPGVN